MIVAHRNQNVHSFRAAMQKFPAQIGDLERLCVGLRERFPRRVKDLRLGDIDFGPLTAAINQHRLEIDFSFPGLLPASMEKRKLALFVIFVSTCVALNRVK